MLIYTDGLILTAAAQEEWFESPVGDRDGGHYVRGYEGTASLYDGDEDDNIEVGQYRCTVIDWCHVIDDGEVTLFDAFDTSANLIEYYPVLFGRTRGALKRSVQKLLDEDIVFLRGNPLILQYVNVYPQHRGHDIGLRILGALIRRYAALDSIVIGLTLPMQFSGHYSDSPKFQQEVGLTPAQISRTAATAKLHKHYARLGFKRVRGGNYIVLCADELKLVEPK
jgi:GNAT superfamily N-acetyltransferase